MGTLGRRAVLAVPAGVFLTGAFNISSHTELRLARGARVVAVMTLERSQWPAVAPFPSYGVCNDGACWRQGPRPAWCSARTQALVSAFGATDVAITGAGSGADADADASVIDGQGCWWWAQFLSKGGLQFCRPQLVNFYNCSGVEVSSVTLADPPFWNLHLWNSSSIHVHDMRIHAAVRPSCPHAAGEHVRAHHHHHHHHHPAPRDLGLAPCRRTSLAVGPRRTPAPQPAPRRARGLECAH